MYIVIPILFIATTMPVALHNNRRIEIEPFGFLIDITRSSIFGLPELSSYNKGDMLMQGMMESSLIGNNNDDRRNRSLIENIYGRIKADDRDEGPTEMKATSGRQSDKPVKDIGHPFLTS